MSSFFLNSENSLTFSKIVNKSRINSIMADRSYLARKQRTVVAQRVTVQFAILDADIDGNQETLYELSQQSFIAVCKALFITARGKQMEKALIVQSEKSY